MKAKIIHALRWDDRLTLAISIVIAAAFVCKEAPVWAIAFGTVSILAHAILLALSYSINKGQ